MNLSWFQDEDGAIIMEFICKGHRIGLNIEQNEQESGWHYVDKDTTHSDKLPDGLYEALAQIKKPPQA